MHDIITSRRGFALGPIMGFCSFPADVGHGCPCCRNHPVSVACLFRETGVCEVNPHNHDYEPLYCVFIVTIELRQIAPRSGFHEPFQA